MFGRILLGVIITGIGFAMVWKTAWLINNFGRIPWFEAHFTTAGGSWLAYKLFGTLGVIIGLLLVTNLYNQALNAILTPLFGRGMV
jgi:hypothetical protein